MFLDLAVAAFGLAVLSVLARQPVIYHDHDCLHVERSLLDHFLATAGLTLWGLLVGYTTAALMAARSWRGGSEVAAVLIVGIACALMVRRRLRAGLIVDRLRDRICQDDHLIARASDVQAIHVADVRQPAVLVLRDDVGHLQNLAITGLGSDGPAVGSAVAMFLHVPLLSIEPGRDSPASHSRT